MELRGICVEAPEIAGDLDFCSNVFGKGFPGYVSDFPQQVAGLQNVPLPFIAPGECQYLSDDVGPSLGIDLQRPEQLRNFLIRKV